MSYKTILAHVEPDWGSDQALLAAVQLAGLFDAHLIGVGAESFDQSGFVYVDGSLVQVMRDMTEQDIAAAERRFRAASSVCSQGATWISEFGAPASAVGRYARGADLVVARRLGPGVSAAAACRPVDLIIECGAPVLVAPMVAEPLACERAVVAWRDGREACRAVSDALPFLLHAEQVLLVQIAPAGERDGAQAQLNDVSRRLSRHGVRVTTDVIDQGHRPVSQHLDDAARQFHADLIVAGAYSHMRMREWVLGGVTEDLLAGCSQYVMFSR